MITIKPLSRLFLLGLVAFGLQSKAQDYSLQNQLYVQWNDARYASTTRIPDPIQLEDLKSKLGVPVDSVRCSFYFSKSAALRRIWRVYLSNPVQRQTALSKLNRESSLFAYAEPVPAMRRFDIPNDLGLNNTNAGGQWYLYKVRATEAWDLQTGSATVRVAVVDDAVQTTHEELTGICLPGYDAADGDFDVEPPTESHDHGTHIAGLIGANTNNGLGMASMGRGIRILPVKITFDTNADLVVAGYEGIAWAVEQDVQVINMSWGAPEYSQTGLLVTQDAVANDIVMVAAAGNANNSIANYPAAYPGILSVASTNTADVRSGFSSFGSWVDISAPGSSIWSLAPGNGYQLKSGTSFAAPLVSGLAALMKSGNPELSNTEIESCIESSADLIDAQNLDVFGQMGSGRLNAYQALLCVSNTMSDYNLSLLEVMRPNRFQCDSWIEPSLKLKNSGTEVITSFTIRYIVGAQMPRFYVFSGELLPGDTLELSMDSVFVAPGNHLLRFSLIENLNAIHPDSYQPDNVLNHYFRVQHPVGLGLPFSENFESTFFNTSNWVVSNTLGDFSWEIAPGESPAIGNWSARLPYYVDDNGEGSRDFLYSPSLDFSGYSSVTLSYHYAYQPRFTGLSDTLIVSASTDCGLSWERLEVRFDGSQPNLSTAAPLAQFFEAISTDVWCNPTGQSATCASVNLSDYAGLSGVLLRFEGYSSKGNNIYIDNINVSGVLGSSLPIASFAIGAEVPVCTNQSVTFVQTSLNQPTSYSWSFQGGVPLSSSAAAPVVSYPNPGVFPVQLIVSNANGIDTLIVSNGVEVIANPTVEILSDRDTICSGETIELSASGASTYLWNPISTLSTTFGQTVIATPQSTTVFIVNGYTETGCSSIANKTITVVPPPATPQITESDFTLVSSPGTSYEWYVNGELQPDLSTQSVTPTINGNYNVKVFDAFGCSSVSPMYAVNWVFMEASESMEIVVFPQPTQDYFVIKTNQTLDYQLFDLQGRIVSVGQSDSPVSMKDCSSGVYLLKLSGVNQHPIFRRVVKQ